MECYGTGSRDATWLVWIHGLLGDRREWRQVAAQFSDRPCALLELPGHGQAAAMRVSDFAELNQLLCATLASAGIHRYCLLGYSLGGRVALYHATQGAAPGLRALVLEGANPGLLCAKARAERVAHDHQWAERFRQQAMGSVLNAWYQQGVFADLSEQQRLELQQQRQHNSGAGVAALLEATSLGVQPWLAESLQQLKIPLAYFCGEQDDKFQHLARELHLPLYTVPDAGHNAHYANPQGFVALLRPFLAQFL
ncbi:MAG: 2-succinyl-6-hydroxy-2,4-cyclohexadiene-1-carboxylate synthase [Enterobacteriaceae bacterium]